MKTELQKKLFDKYPIIFQDRNKPMTETCMCWGVDTGDGWYNLIDKLCSELMYISKKHDVIIIADQVKEKYGTLRFYYSVKLGNRWTYHPMLVIKVINDITRRLPYKYFNWLQHPIWKFYNWTRKFENRLDGKVFITEERGHWIRHGRKMFAYNGINDIISDVVGKYEDLSEMICEDCGSSAQLKCKYGWYKTICDKCGNEDGYEIIKEEESI